MMIQPIYIFDVDNTLIDTQAKVKIVDDQGNILYKVSSQYYNAHMKSIQNDKIHGIHCNYDEFRSLELLLNEPKLKSFEDLKVVASIKPYDTYIITSREDRQFLSVWLEVNGIYIPAANIITNNLKGRTLGKWKSDELQDIMTNYEDQFIEIHIWEDDKDCVQQMSDIRMPQIANIIMESID